MSHANRGKGQSLLCDAIFMVVIMGKRKQVTSIQGSANHRRTEGDYMGVLLKFIENPVSMRDSDDSVPENVRN